MNVLIICTDARGTSLADALAASNSFRVVVGRWSSDVKEMEFFLHRAGDTVYTAPLIPVENLPQCVDALFFHTGFPDRGHVPAQLDYRLEFAFSADGLGETADIGDRGNAIRIRRSYRVNGPPLVPKHRLPEFEELIRRGERRTPDWLCADETPAPLLTTIAILCQAYLAAWISEEKVAGSRATTPLAEEIGWPRMDPDTTTHLAARLKPLLAQMREPEWWIGHLVPVDPAPVTAHTHKPEEQERKRKRIFATLIAELGLEARARTDPQLRGVEDLAAAPAVRLAAVLAGQPGYDKIAALLSGPSIDDDTVVGAYRQVKAALDAR